MTIKNYLVTGSEGFVGFNLSNHIKKLGHNVFGVDLNNGKDNLKNWRKLQLDNSGVKTFNVDISDKYQIQDFENNIKDVHFQGIFHLAGLAGVRKSLEIPKKYYDVNLRGTLNVLNLSKKFNVNSFTFSSTSSVYGGSEHNSKENDDLYPISPYANSKLLAEKICKLYSDSGKLNIAILRYFTVYGEAGRPDMSVLKFVDSIAKGNPIVIYGDGKQERDFTYVGDVCEATFKSSTLKGFNILNIGNSNPVKLMNIVKIIEKILEKKADIIFEPKNNLDVFKTHSDNSRAMKLLNWAPKYKVEEGLLNTINWYKKNIDVIGKLS